MHTKTYNRQLSSVRRGMLLPATQLQLQRLVFSHCQKTVVTLSICRARGCLRTPQPSFCLKEDYPDYTKILTGIGLKVKVEILSSSITTYFCKRSIVGCLWKQPEQHTRPSSMHWVSPPGSPTPGLSGPALTESGPVYQNCGCKWSLSSSHTPSWGVELDDTLSTTQGHLDWQMEKQTKSPGHPCRSWQPSSRQTSKNRWIGANHEPTQHHIWLNSPIKFTFK